MRALQALQCVVIVMEESSRQFTEIVVRDIQNRMYGRIQRYCNAEIRLKMRDDETRDCRKEQK